MIDGQSSARNSFRFWARDLSNRTPLFLLAFGEFALSSLVVYLVARREIELGSTALGGPGELAVKALFVGSVIVVSLTAMGLYHFQQRLYFKETLARLSVGLVLGTLALAAIYFLLPSLSLPRKIFPAAGLLVLTILLVTRWVFFRCVDTHAFRLRTLVYGAGDKAKSISDLRRRADRRGFQVVMTIPAVGDRDPASDEEARKIALSIPTLAQENGIDEIVVAVDERRGILPLRELLECKLSGINVIEVVEFLERELGKVRVDLASPGSLIFGKGFEVSGLRLFGKRAADLLISALAMILASPFFVLAAVAIKIEDGLRAPLFYRQTRIGKNGVPFSIIKFRSMVEDAESRSGAVWAEEDDPRITRVGRILRKFRIDELPQILNVLKGDMSIVGPRPERPEFVTDLAESIPYYMERHIMKPGITGWAQLRYPYGSTRKDALEKLQYDLFYVKHQSLVLDIVIMLQTIEVIIWRKGAR